MTSPSARARAPRGSVARTVAQAKINLFLRVLAREASGYHQIETLFCRLELGDDVVVRTNVRGRSLDCTGDAVPAAGLGPVEDNLAWRAVAAYSAVIGWPNEWAIEIRKRIPVGGGLGGGSADAGAVLRCLNALAPAPLRGDALVTLGATLGADVPFLTLDAPLALAWGRGDRLLVLPPLPLRDVTLVCFPFGVPTRDAYAWLDDALGDRAPSASAHELPQLGIWAHVAAMAHNDFEEPVAVRHPDIAHALASLRAAAALHGDPATFALLTGSGSTVYYVSDAPASVPSALVRAPARAVRTRTATRVADIAISDS